ncbi:lipid droplet-associated protein [Mycobacterium sp. M1]|uniref:Lipid droplet-associated protein n=1 Tax=Mycolicibacter acidiphilus TaxID=2835306 RepID=A0ABS5RK74_9MYCO|nr:lipid droplet-associated protein [Mycolicibacter acidiphilus]MBS9534692.1 lipid droplet-associated protein [Mycolicibacter acidiphilus]
MATAPYGVRLLVGAATVAVEETIKLPHTILMYPMTLASQAAHMVMAWQQGIAELVNKGDSTLESLFPPKDEQPEWATFDEDLPDDDAGQPQPTVDGGAGDQRGDGRFALYSFSDDDRPAPGTATTAAAKPQATTSPAVTPDLVVELDYGTLTLAQLRARLNSLSIDELETLLAYEEATKARAPFQTLLANRITRASAK